MANRRKARVIVPYLQIHKAPGLETDTNTKYYLRYGQIVRVDLDQETSADGFVWWKHSVGWSKAHSDDNTQVFMELPETQEGPRITPTNQSGQAQFIVVTGGLRVRKAAGLSAPIEGHLLRDQLVTVDTMSKKELDGYWWWELTDGGWAASGSIDNSQIYMEPYKLPQPGEESILTVPWTTQVTVPEIRLYDCGPACIHMLLAYYHKLPPGGISVDGLADKISLSNIYTGTGQLITLAKAFDLKLERLSLENNLQGFSRQLRTEIDRDKPVGLLVEYAFLEFYDNPLAGTFGHWLVVVGYSGDKFIVNDPYWMPGARGGAGGSNIRIESGKLLKAYRGNPALQAFR